MILFCLIFSFSRGYSQLNENEIKAAYILNFLDNLTFENQGSIDTLRIVILDDEKVLYATKKIATNKSIKGIPVAVYSKKVSNTQIVYIPLSSKNSFKDYALQYQKSAVVANQNHYMGDIRFVTAEDQSINFLINDQNLKNKNIEPSSALLVYSENKSEVLSLIDMQQVKLDELKEQSKELSQELSKKEEEVNDLNKKIKDKESRLVELNSTNFQKTQQLQSMQLQIAAKEEVLTKINKDHEAQQEELNQLKTRLDENYSEINLIGDSVKKLQLLLDEKKKLVQKNEELLLSQQNQITKQEGQIEDSDQRAARNFNLLLVAGGFSILVIIALYFFIRENRAKRDALVTIEEQNISIQQASKQKDEFISNLSHEVRSPLNAIIGYTDLIRNSIKDKETQKHLEYITMSSKNLLGMINDILDYRRIEVGKGQLEKDNFELRSVVNVAFNTLRITAEKKGLEYNLIYDSNLPQYVYSDSKKLNQVILNLLSNAIKFTAIGKVELHVNNVACSDDSCVVRFAVIDTGIGIDKANQKKIFETFTQESALTTREFGGSGLGLSISKKIADLFNSKIIVESEPGHGATFSFDLNLTLGESSDQTDAEEQKIIVEGLDKIKILAVDDLIINRTLVLKQFESVGCKENVTTANDGLEAIELINQNHFDLILTDIRMPSMGGIEMTQSLRKENYNTPIIGISANNLKIEKDECMEAGMNGYIVKPYSFDELLIQIANLLNLTYRTTQKEAIKKVPTKEFSFDRLKVISESDEEFDTLKTEIFDQVTKNIQTLKEKLSIEAAHENANKAGYMGSEHFLALCRDLEKEIRANESQKAKLLLEEIEEMLQKHR